MKNQAQLTDEAFKTEVLNADVPVLVNFYSPWSGPGRTFTPVLDSLADEFDGRIRIVNVNVDAAPGWAERYGVASEPALTLFHNGGLMDGLMDVNSLPELKRRLHDVVVSPRSPKSRN